MKNRQNILFGNIPMLCGLLLVMLAAALCGFNIAEEYHASSCVQNVRTLLIHKPLYLPISEQYIPDYILDSSRDMPISRVEGNAYIGMLEIPILGLSLPVMSDWDHAKLKTTPCRYHGSAYTNNFIIAGHNYLGHFGQLKNLQVGDSLYFTDIDGNGFFYRVSELQSLAEKDVEFMLNGEWDLTLFTCTMDGERRVTVRCTRTT